jgi:hypothetical protein
MTKEPSPGRSQVNNELKRIWGLNDSGQEIPESDLKYISDYYETQYEYWKSKLPQPPKEEPIGVDEDIDKAFRSLEMEPTPDCPYPLMSINDAIKLCKKFKDKWQSTQQVDKWEQATSMYEILHKSYLNLIQQLTDLKSQQVVKQPTVEEIELEATRHCNDHSFQEQFRVWKEAIQWLQSYQAGK